MCCGREDQPFGHSTICVQRNWAMGLAAPWGVTTASHTCVVRPWCNGFATQTMTPSRAEPKKLLLSSMVVKPDAPAARQHIMPWWEQFQVVRALVPSVEVPEAFRQATPSNPGQGCILRD